MTVESVKVCVIGFGVSSLPLLRLLEKSNIPFRVVTEKFFGIWGALKESGDNFDLLSTVHTATFSWWDDVPEFPFISAQEFARRLFNDITPTMRRNTIQCKAYRYVRDSNGLCTVVGEDGAPLVTCEHLVITTTQQIIPGEILKMCSDSLKMHNKTVLIEGYSDTSNMLMARLMLGNNNVIFKTNHFCNLEKMVALPSGAPEPYGPYDVYEEYWHLHDNNFARSNRSSFHSTVAPYSDFWLSKAFRKSSGLDKLITPSDFHRPVPSDAWTFMKVSGISNGMGLPVKYWPVDAYFHYLEGLIICCVQSNLYASVSAA
jgi:hypothetical protein